MKKVVDITSIFKEGINDNDLISSLEPLPEMQSLSGKLSSNTKIFHKGNKIIVNYISFVC